MLLQQLAHLLFLDGISFLAVLCHYDVCWLITAKLHDSRLLLLSLFFVSRSRSMSGTVVVYIPLLF